MTLEQPKVRGVDLCTVEYPCITTVSPPYPWFCIHRFCNHRSYLLFHIYIVFTIERHPCGSGPMQFKPVFFQSHLHLGCRHLPGGCLSPWQGVNTALYPGPWHATLETGHLRAPHMTDQRSGWILLSLRYTIILLPS